MESGWAGAGGSCPPAQPSLAQPCCHQYSSRLGERRRAAQSVSERWEEPREEPGIHPWASIPPPDINRSPESAAGKARSTKLRPGAAPWALLPRGHAGPTSPSPGFVHFHPFPAETGPGKIHLGGRFEPGRFSHAESPKIPHRARAQGREGGKNPAQLCSPVWEGKGPPQIPNWGSPAGRAGQAGGR